MNQEFFQNTKRQPALGAGTLVDRGAHFAGANLFDERGKQICSDDGKTLQELSVLGSLNNGHRGLGGHIDSRQVGMCGK